MSKQRFNKLLKTLLLKKSLLNIVIVFIGFIRPKLLNNKKQEATIHTLEDFVIKLEIDHLNLRPLVEFCRNTRLAPKLHGFSLRYNQQELEAENNKQKCIKKASFKEFLSNMSKNKDGNDQLEQTPKVEVKPSDQVKFLNSFISYILQINILLR